MENFEIRIQLSVKANILEDGFEPTGEEYLTRLAELIKDNIAGGYTYPGEVKVEVEAWRKK